jgi:hypothetical protein
MEWLLLEMCTHPYNALNPSSQADNMKKIRIIFIFLLLATLTGSHVSAQVSIRITASIAPPPLVVYEQPPCPEDGYLWTPGYWAYGDDGYFWVPGAWVRPPRVLYLWTPPYWGYSGGFYRWNAGYWGPHVGFYGGIDYGYGYNGYGFGGGMWSGNTFRYNTAVMNVNRTVVHNTYIDRTVIVNRNTNNNHISYNGPGGITAKPRAQEQAAMRENHVKPTTQQQTHVQAAHNDRNQFNNVNHGKPPTPVIRGNEPAAARPNNNPANRPAQPRAGETRPAQPGPTQSHPSTPRPGQTRPVQPNPGQQPRPAQPIQEHPRPVEPKPVRPKPEAPRTAPMPRQEQPRPVQPRQEHPRPVEPRPVQPRPQQPRTAPMPRQEQPRPQQPHQQQPQRPPHKEG